VFVVVEDGERLRQQHQQRRADHRARHAGQPADHHHRHVFDRGDEARRVRRDEAVQQRQQPARDRRIDRGDDEGAQLVAATSMPTVRAATSLSCSAASARPEGLSCRFSAIQTPISSAPPVIQ
jgi:hypothetical protein